MANPWETPPKPAPDFEHISKEIETRLQEAGDHPPLELLRALKEDIRKISEEELKRLGAGGRLLGNREEDSKWVGRFLSLGSRIDRLIQQEEARMEKN
jgi:hypothetical protein